MEIRAATAPDVPAMVDVMFLEPSRDAVALVGSVDGARRFQREVLSRAITTPGNAVRVAVDDAEVVGFAFVSDGSDTPPARDLVSMALRSFGFVGTIRSAWRARTRARVDLKPPDGGLHLVELQVHPHRRGAGIGATLLDAAEAYAREEGAGHLSLTTGAANPARRLYERHGYELVGEKLDDAYERLTGSPGRILMVKSLS